MSKTVADVKDANKRGALHFAAREGKTDVCKYLLEELKLEVDTQDEDGLHHLLVLHTVLSISLFFFSVDFGHEFWILLKLCSILFRQLGTFLF